ncbi:MAG: (Fe-S)-binding protein [Candidatus Thorarchaeota archaeon]
MTEIDMDELMENLAQCRRCGICRNAVYEDMGFDGVCPVWKNTAGFETSFMRGRIEIAIALLEGILEKNEDNAEALYACTLCGACTTICGAEFDPAKSLEQVRAVLNDIPNEARDSISEKIMENDNPYVQDNSAKRDWMSEVGFEPPATGETLYFIGCTASLKLPEVAKATLKVLKAANVDFAVLENEPCCGSVLLRTGKLQEAEKNADRVVEAISKSGAKRIVVTCAGCHRTLKKDYPEIFGKEMPEVVHAAELTRELISAGKLKLGPIGEDVKITYHDPCHSARELGMYEEPREVIEAIPGVTLVEMETNRAAAMCCGAGGGLRSYDGQLAKKIAADRVRTAEETGASILATACPFCELNLAAGASLESSQMEVVDIMSLLEKSVE